MKQLSIGVVPHNILKLLQKNLITFYKIANYLKIIQFILLKTKLNASYSDVVY